MKQDESCNNSGCPEACGQNKACSLFSISDRFWQTLEQNIQKNRMTQEMSVNVQEVINWAVLSEKKQHYINMGPIINRYGATAKIYVHSNVPASHFSRKHEAANGRTH
jgi:hypothetical protein